MFLKKITALCQCPLMLHLKPPLSRERQAVYLGNEPYRDFNPILTLCCLKGG